jgi:hypothetical protein
MKLLRIAMRRYSMRNDILSFLVSHPEKHLEKLELKIAESNVANIDTLRESLETYGDLGMVSESVKLTETFKTVHNIPPTVETLNTILRHYTHSFFNRKNVPEEFLVTKISKPSLNQSDPCLDNILNLIKLFKFKYNVTMNEETMNILINCLALQGQYELLHQMNEFYTSGKITPDDKSMRVYMNYYLKGLKLDDAFETFKYYVNINIIPERRVVLRMIMEFGKRKDLPALQKVVDFIEKHSLVERDNEYYKILREAYLAENELKDPDLVAKYLDKIVESTIVQ